MTEAAFTRKTAGERTPVPFVDLGPVSREIKDSLLDDLGELIDTGRFVNGPKVEQFEHDFAASCGRATCVGVASGLDALRLALLAFGLKRGDEVVVPAMTFVATFEAVVQAGGRPVVVDVREDDIGMDVEAAAEACTERTRFLVPVHLHGQMADVRALQALAGQHDLVVVEDACQAHGAERDGIRAGAAGNAGAFSFYPSKNLGAFGDAGAVVLDDEKVAAVIRALREHGEISKYESVRVGYTARLDALQALVLSRKLPLLERWNAERRDAADFYSESLDGIGDLRLPATVDGATHVWHVYAIRTGDPTSLAAFLAERRIATSRHYAQAPHLSLAFEHLGLRTGSYPVAEAVARETLSLPMFPGISEEQLEAVVGAVSEYFARG
jgi:dTDP-3-amino-3,4,6-trideoxy-alpha-D-glucose transaminase